MFLGYMFDVTRSKVPHVTEIFNLIDKLQILGYNHLELYIEHAFMFQGKETAWRDASALSPADIQKIDSYAQSKGIELVPNCNTFGHLERFLKHDEFRQLSECPDANPPHVIFLDEKGLDFINSLLASYTRYFSCGKLNIGCDETMELGKGKSAERCEKIGKGRVYLEGLLKVYQLAKKYSKKIFFWGDIILQHPELIPELPKDATVLNWGYEEEHPFAEETAEITAAGLDLVVCPGTSSWNSIAGRSRNMLNNIISAMNNANKNKAAGLMLTDWGDRGHIQYPYLSYAGLCAASIAFYEGTENVTEEKVARKINKVFFNDIDSPFGELILEFGHLHEVFKNKIANATLFNVALLYEDYPQAPELLEKVSEEEIDEVCRKFDTVKKKFDNAADDSFIAGEMKNSLRLVEVAIMRLKQNKSLPYDKKRAYNLITEAIAEHCTLWLTRNRIGGMEESLKHFENARKSFRN